MAGLWVNNIKPSQEGLGNGGMGEWGVGRDGKMGGVLLRRSGGHQFC